MFWHKACFHITYIPSLVLDVWKKQNCDNRQLKSSHDRFGKRSCSVLLAPEQGAFSPLHNINRPPHLLLCTAGGERRWHRVNVGGRPVGVWQVGWTSSHVEKRSHGRGQEDEWAQRRRRTSALWKCWCVLDMLGDDMCVRWSIVSPRPVCWSSRRSSKLLIRRHSSTLCKLLTYS